MVPPKGFSRLKNGKLFLFFLVFTLILSFSTYSVEAFTWNRPTIITATLNVNHSETSNSSDFWDGLDDPTEIDHNLLNNLAWSVAGHTIDTNIDMDGNDIQDIDKAYFGATTYISSDDNYHLDLHADYIDLHGNLSTIWEVLISGDGDGVGGDVHGELVFGSRDAYLYYNGSDFIIDPDAIGTGDVVILGNIRADNFIGSGAELTDLNVTGSINVTGDFTGYALNTSYLYGALGIGGIDMRGDPWYFSGADLEINSDLKVNNTEIENELTVGSNVTIGGWFNGKFNWTSGDTWNIFEGSTLTFNESKFNSTLDSTLLGDFWFFYEEDLVSGTSDGTISLTQQYDDYDGISYNLTEAVPGGLEYYANTSNNVSTDVNKICIRYIAKGDDFDVSIWDISLDDWEGYMVLTPNSDFVWKCVDIRDSADHLVDGKIMIKIVDAYQSSTQHKLYIDAIYVSSGYTPRIGNEVDPVFSPWLLNPILEHNLNMSGNNITNINWLYSNNINVTNLFAGGINVSEFLQDFDGNEYAQYEFGVNNFNGSGDFNTIGDISTNCIDITSTIAVGNVGSDLNPIPTNTRNLGTPLLYYNNFFARRGYLNNANANPAGAEYIGLDSSHTITGATTDYLDQMFAQRNVITINSGDNVGNTFGQWNQAIIKDGTVGDASHGRHVYGTLSYVLLETASKVEGKVHGNKMLLTQQAGSVIDGETYGQIISINLDGTHTGTVYGFYLDEVDGVDYGFYQDGDSPNVFGGDVLIGVDNKVLSLGTNQDANISWDGTNLIFDYNSTNPNAVAWFSGNLSAISYDTRTSVFDKSENVWDYIKDSDDYINPDGSINHPAFYGYKINQIRDPDNCSEVLDYIEYRYFNLITADSIKSDTQRLDLIKEGYVEEIKEIYKTICGTKLEEVVSLNDEIDLLRQGVFELKQENQKIKDCAKNSIDYKAYQTCIAGV